MELPAELIQVDQMTWSDPVAQWGNRIHVTYTYDRETGLKEGIYLEMWLVSDGPDVIYKQVNYIHGEKHGEELLHEYPTYAPNWNKRVYWDHGEETGGKETRFWGWGPDDPNRPMEIREWEWNGDNYHETSNSYHEANGALASYYETRALNSGDLWITIESYSVGYNLNGTKSAESWSKSFRKEDGTWQTRYIGPFHAQWREDGTQWFWRGYDENGERHGKWQEWTEEGILKYTQNYQHGLQNGPQYNYDSSNGALYSTWVMQMGIRHGIYQQFDPATGRLVNGGQYSNGNQCGTWTSYRSDGSVASVYDHGDCQPLVLVEENPIFDEEAEPETIKWIEGLVFDKIRKLPLGGVAVDATGGYQTVTDPVGKFRLQLGSGALYTLTLSTAGYNTRSGRLDMGDYQTRTLNIGLIPEGSDDKPRILEVESQFGDVFFEGLVANNRYTVDIGWGEGTADGINFKLNGVDHAGTIIGDQGLITFNMGSALKPGLGSTTNTLNVIASNSLGIASDPEILHPLLVPLPSWLTGLGTLSAGESEAGLINYKLSLQWPDEPVTLELNQANLGSLGWQAWSLIPLVGGQPFGLKSTQALLELELKTDGNGSALFGGQTGLRAGGQEITGKVGGRGHYYYRSGKGIEWKKGSLLVGIEGTIEKEAGVVDVIPALASAVNLPVVGRGIAWINRQAKVNGVIGMGSEIELDILDQEGSLDFSHSEASLKASLKLGLGGGEGKLKLKFTGSGEARALFQIPANPDYLKQVEAELAAELAVTAWLFQKSFSASHTFSYPTALAYKTLSANYPLDDAVGFRPISRSFAESAGYHRIAPEVYRNLSSTDETTWTTRLENVYPDTQLQLYSDQSIHYIHFDPAKQTLRATEWHEFSLGNRLDYPRTDDQNADFGLSISNVAAWMRVKDPAFPQDGTLEQMAAQIEIACSNIYLTPEKSPLYVTDNDYLDMNPVVTGDYTGYVLFWESNQGNQLVGSAEWPSQIHHAVWGGDTLGFQTIKTVPGSFIDATSFTYASKAGELAMAWIQDMDGDMATETDREIFTRYTVGGVWTDPLRITTNATGPESPRLLVTPSGEFELFWLEEGSLYSAFPDTPGMSLRSAAADLPPVTRFLANTLVANKPVLFLIRQDGDERDASVIRWDATTVSWTPEIPLRCNLNGVDVHDFALQNYKDRSFLFAGLRESDSGTDIVTATALLPLGDLSYSIPSSFNMPVPVPGESFTVPVDYVNAGNDPLDDPVIAIYGDSLDAPNQLSQAQIPGTLAPGDRGQVLLSFTVPEMSWPKQLLVCRSRADGVALATNKAISIGVSSTDLEILRIQHISNPDGSSTARVTLRNNGPFAASSIPVELVSGSQTLSRAMLSGLFPGKSAEVDLQVWPAEDFLKDAPTLTAVLDPQDTVSDTDLTNNILNFQLPGDDGLWSLSPQAGSFKFVDWFGILQETTAEWAYHFDLGWMFVEAEDIGSLYFYDVNLGSWIWTRYDIFPCFYHFGEQGWWWFEGSRAKPVGR
jgi:hypothetical protein